MTNIPRQYCIVQYISWCRVCLCLAAAAVVVTVVVVVVLVTLTRSRSSRPPPEPWCQEIRIQPGQDCLLVRWLLDNLYM